MPIYIDTTGNSVLSVAVCDRCSRKFAYVDLMPDPNFPGMRVCKDDLDKFDPWRLPARQTEKIALRFPRPDVSIALVPNEVLTESGFTNGNSVLIEGVPPAGGATGDINTYSSQSNTLLPQIESTTPNNGNIVGGESVTIAGVNFGGATAVYFGNVPSSNYQVINSTQIQAVTPQSSVTGPVNVTVVTAFGMGIATGMFTYQ